MRRETGTGTSFAAAAGGRDTAVFVALVSDERAARLAGAMPRDAHLRLLESWDQLDGVSRLLPDVIIIDPLAGGEPPGDQGSVLSMIARSAPLVVYTSVTPVAMRRLLTLPVPARTRLLLAGLDDGPRALQTLLGNIQFGAHRIHALEKLPACTGPLPEEVSRALSDLLRAPYQRLTVDRLARTAQMSARTLERRLSEADAPPPQWLIRAVQALVARELLSRSGLTVQGVMREIGYAKPASLRALLRWSFGATPSLLRRGQARASGPQWRTRRAGPSSETQRHDGTDHAVTTL